MKERHSLLDEWFEIWRETDSAYVKLLKRWNLSLHAWQILEMLRQHPDGLEPAVIAARNNMFRQAVTVVLNEFESHAWIVREADRNDRRRKKIRLTAAGRAFADQVIPEMRLIEEECIAVLNPDEQRQLVDLTRKFSRRLLLFSQ